MTHVYAYVYRDIYKCTVHLYISIYYIPTNTPRVFHVETTWKRLFPRRFNVEYTWSVCWDVYVYVQVLKNSNRLFYQIEIKPIQDELKKR